MTTEGSDRTKHIARHLANRPLSLKPATKRRGVEAWFPYYAGYSSEFVRQALIGLDSKPGWTVLDPWNGSGTTTHIADSFGCDALGFDINPAAALVASARLTRAADATHSFGLASEVLVVADRSRVEVDPSEPLASWLSVRLIRRYRSIERAILDLLGTKAGARIDIDRATPPPFASFFLLCLLRAARRFIRIQDNSNPTWISPARRGDARTETLDRAFLAMVRAGARDAEEAGLARDPSRIAGSRVAIADARALPLPDAAVDAVITSPPYCTRVDYFKAMSFELAALGIAPDGDRFRELRSQAMGTNLMRKDHPIDVDSQPASVRQLLQRIQSHPSKASDTYYYRSFAQYFDDALRSLREIRRVLKSDAPALLVVQSSYYKNIPIALGDLYAALGATVGMRSRVVHHAQVRRVLATINSRATTHERNRRYTEDVVALQRGA
jgi:DNA modification methylase